MVRCFVEMDVQICVDIVKWIVEQSLFFIVRKFAKDFTAMVSSPLGYIGIKEINKRFRVSILNNEVLILTAHN